MRLNKHEMLLVLQTRTRCGDRQPRAERGHLQARLIFLSRGENWSPTTAHPHLCVPVMKCPPEKSEMGTGRSRAMEEGLRIQLRRKRAFLTNLKPGLSCKMARTECGGECFSFPWGGGGTKTRNSMSSSATDQV